MGQSLSVPTEGGISYEAFSAYAVNEMKVPTHVVDLKATFDRYKDQSSNLITVENVLDLKLKTDIFLTHDWGIDELGQSNHDRVAIINKELKSLGFVTWFDSEKMTGDVVDQMVSGIDNASVVIVFITQRYMSKVNGSDANDNCRKEFKYAAQRKSSTKMIPVVMEPRMKDIRGNWTGLVQMELGNILYVDFSNDNDFQSAIQQLKAEILSRTNPLWVLRTTPVDTPPHPHPVIPSTVSTPNDTDRLMIDQLSSWFGSIDISSAVARRYAELLVEKNSGSVTKLQRKLERNVNYLEEIGGFDEDDIIDIKEGLKLPATQTAQNGSSKEFFAVFSQEPQIINFEMGKQKDNSVLVNTAVIDSQRPLALKKEEMKQMTTAIMLHSRTSSDGQAAPVVSLSWSSVVDKIASGSADNTIKIWGGKSLELIKTLQGHSGWVRSVSWNHDGSQIVSGSADKTIKIWDSSTGIILHTLEGHSDWVLSVSWNRDSSKIISGSFDRTIKIWGQKKSTLETKINWVVLMTLEGHSGYVYSVSWKHDSSKIVSGSKDKTIKIWDSSTGIVLRTLTGHSDFVHSTSWSHDDSKIVSGSFDKTVKIWNAITGDLMKTLEGHSEWVYCVAWSPDDRKIASCSYEEKKIIIWDAVTGQVMHTIYSVEDVRSMAWSSDGSELVCSSAGNIKVFSFSNSL
jgi:WD40 repeat protein